MVVVGAKPGIVGAAAGLDLFATPYHRFDLRGDLPLTSGVEIQATGLANLLGRNWLVRSNPRISTTGWSRLPEFSPDSRFTRLRPVRGMFVALLWHPASGRAGTFPSTTSGCGFHGAWSHFCRSRWPCVWGTATHFYVERFFRVKLDEEQRQLRDAFAKYLSPQMLERLTAEGFQMRVGGEKVEAAMMFTDLENFTNMCERVGDPERIVGTLNDYFERTTSHIFDHDGVVIKFIGDAIFAVWGAPIREPDAALKAARAAWKLFQSDKLVVDGVTLRTRIGVHFGEVVAGNIGSARRVDYTLIGDAVNLSARLESLNKTLGTNILISDEVQQRLGGEFRTRLVGRFKVKGRREVTVIHELLGPVVRPGEPEWISFYHQALEAYAQQGFQRGTQAVPCRRGKPRRTGRSVQVLHQPSQPRRVEPRRRGRNDRKVTTQDDWDDPKISHAEQSFVLVSRETAHNFRIFPPGFMLSFPPGVLWPGSFCPVPIHSRPRRPPGRWRLISWSLYLRNMPFPLNRQTTTPSPRFR